MSNLTQSEADIIAQLPKTRDGVIIVPGKGIRVYHPSPDFVDEEGCRMGHIPEWDAVSGKWMIFDYPVSECFYTEADCDNFLKEIF